MVNHDIILEEQILAKDVLTSPVITVKENACIPLVARLMEHYNIGSIVVINKDGKPLGIITERDLLVRILTKISNKTFIKQFLEINPHTTITAKDVMTSPLITITPFQTLVEAARIMHRQKIQRLGVVSNGKLNGIISNKDILAITPDLMDILREKKKIVDDPFFDDSMQLGITGYCENCENWSNSLTGSNGILLCEECLV